MTVWPAWSTVYLILFLFPFKKIWFHLSSHQSLFQTFLIPTLDSSLASRPPSLPWGCSEGPKAALPSAPVPQLIPSLPPGGPKGVLPSHSYFLFLPRAPNRSWFWENLIPLIRFLPVTPSLPFYRHFPFLFPLDLKKKTHHSFSSSLAPPPPPLAAPSFLVCLLPGINPFSAVSP